MYRYLPNMTPHFTTDGRSTKIHACKWQVRTLECMHYTALFFQNSTALKSITDIFSYKYNGNSLEIKQQSNFATIVKMIFAQYSSNNGKN